MSWVAPWKKEGREWQSRDVGSMQVEHFVLGLSLNDSTNLFLVILVLDKDHKTVCHIAQSLH